MDISKLSEQTRNALEIIVEYTAIDGSSLMRKLGASQPEEIVKTLRELERRGLVEVGGSMTPDGLPFAKIGVRPSAKDYLRNLLRQSAA